MNRLVGQFPYSERLPQYIGELMQKVRDDIPLKYIALIKRMLQYRFEDRIKISSVYKAYNLLKDTKVEDEKEIERIIDDVCNNQTIPDTIVPIKGGSTLRSSLMLRSVTEAEEVKIPEFDERDMIKLSEKELRTPIGKLYKVGEKLHFSLFDPDLLSMSKLIDLTTEFLSQTATIVLSPTGRIFLAGGNRKENGSVEFLD